MNNCRKIYWDSNTTLVFYYKSDVMKDNMLYYENNILTINNINYPAYLFKEGLVVLLSSTDIRIAFYDQIDEIVKVPDKKLEKFEKCNRGFKLYYPDNDVYIYQNHYIHKLNIKIDYNNIDININNYIQPLLVFDNGFTINDILPIFNKKLVSYYSQFEKKLLVYISSVDNFYHFKEYTAYQISKKDKINFVIQKKSDIILISNDIPKILNITENKLINCFSSENGVFYLTYDDNTELMFNI